MRVGYTTRVRFFADSDQTTLVHWYLVPKDRPCLPVASFVQDADWANDNGFRPIILKGEPPFTQGEQWADRPYTAKPARPFEKYTGHYCGTGEQWAGKLSIDNPADLGSYGCCIVGQLVGYDCECSLDTFSYLYGPLGLLVGCECDKDLLATSAAVSWAVLGCSCGIALATAFPTVQWSVADCECSTGLMSSAPSGAYHLLGCECIEATAVVGAHGTYFLTGCECATGDVSYSSSTTWAVLECECMKDTLTQSPGGKYAILGCECTKDTLTQSHGGKYAVLGCECTKDTFTETSFVPLTAFNCSTATAAGSTQGTATAIGDDQVDITVPSLGTGVILPSGCYRIVLRNLASINGCNVYPPSGERIGTLMTNAADTLTAGSAFLYVRMPGGVWKRFSSSL